MKIRRFEEIEAWKAARHLARNIYAFSGQGIFSRDFALRNQIQRAAISVMANIAEGFDSFSGDDFIRFLIIARRSATEIQSHLYVALDRKYISEHAFNDIYCEVVKVKNLICGFIRYLRTAKNKRNNIVSVGKG